MEIVSNSSPLIALAKIRMLDVLSGVVIPKAVFDEITKPEKESGAKHPWNDRCSIECERKRIYK
ncbi:MAG: hypothetical protein N2V75_12920 [Methanophagales archaeon]|nr:hypothetical protein [Methanophagales archaeon]